MLHAARRLRVAAPTWLLAAFVGFATLAAPHLAIANEAALAFERFTSDRVQILRARALRASTRPELRPGPQRAVITYRAVGEEFDTEIEPTDVGAVPYVGALHYTELVFSCEDLETQRCVEVASRPMTEIFRYRDGTWGH